MIANTERAARADERAKLDVAKERERLALRHTERKLQASERLFKRAHEVLRQSTKGTRPHDSARMFAVAALLGDQAVGINGSGSASFGLNPIAPPNIRVVINRDQQSDQVKRNEDAFFAAHPELIRPRKWPDT